MARKGRRGSLSKKTYFPGTGDELENHDGGIVWYCAKSNTYKEEGLKVRYALLLGTSSEMDEKLPWAVQEGDEREWLNGINTIRRKLPGEGEPFFRVYDWNKDSGTWQQRMEED